MATHHRRMAYAAWWYACEEMDVKYSESGFMESSEDLGDFAQSLITMRTFGPNPRSFDPPITKEDVAQWLMEGR